MNKPIPSGEKFVYACFFICGCGFLFPYNTFIAAADYFNVRYADYKSEFYFSLIYTYSTLFFLGVSACTVSKLSFTTKIRAGYMTFLPSLICVPLLELLIQKDAGDSESNTFTAFVITAVLVGLNGVGCGIQQGSYYGYSGMFPAKFTMALMTGEAIAGILVCLNRIVTKSSFDRDLEGSHDMLVTSTVIYFIVSAVFILVCWLVFERARRQKFSLYYTSLAGAKDASRAMPDGDYIHLETSMSNTNEDALDSSEPQSIPLDSKDESFSTERKSSLWAVVKAVRHPSGACYLTFLVTLSVYPGLITMVESPTIGDWYPIILVTLFNISDFLGRILCPQLYPLSTSKLWVFACLRIIFVPSVILLVSPHTAPTHQGFEIWLAIVVFLLGLSNGCVGSLAMMKGPDLVQSIDKELAGNVMAFSLLFGLSSGASFAFALEKAVH